MRSSVRRPPNNALQSGTGAGAPVKYVFNIAGANLSRHKASELSAERIFICDHT